MRGNHRQTVHHFAARYGQTEDVPGEGTQGVSVTAKKKNKTRAEIKTAIGRRLRFVSWDLNIIDTLLSSCEKILLNEKDRTYVESIRKVFEQQKYMRKNKTHTVAEGIVSIHQHNVRPIVRRKDKAKVEFGSKINVSLVDGYAFLDHLSWDAYNEGGYLMQSLTKYKERHGHYPAEVMGDRIYCNRVNRRMLK